jgi:hypothetical protein
MSKTEYFSRDVHVDAHHVQYMPDEMQGSIRVGVGPRFRLHASSQGLHLLLHLKPASSQGLLLLLHLKPASSQGLLLLLHLKPASSQGLLLLHHLKIASSQG